MNKLVIGVILLLVLVGGFFAYSYFSDRSEDAKEKIVSDLDSELQILLEQDGIVEEDELARTEPQNYNIEIKSFSFNPSELEISVGDTVIWTNLDSMSHTVTSDSGEELNSAYLSKGEIYSHTFTAAGTFDYHCAPHPYMNGKIIVE